jgi:hypothetical protein
MVRAKVGVSLWASSDRSRRRYCNFNPDKRFASCDVPQELPTHEIDNIDEEDDDNTDVHTHTHYLTA